MPTVRETFKDAATAIQEASMALDNALDTELTGDPDNDYDVLEAAAGAASNFADTLESVHDDELGPRLKELEEA